MDTKRPTKKAKTETETESLLPGPEADEAEETADANDSAPSAEEAESTQAPDAETQDAESQAAQDDTMPSNAQPIIYAGVLLVRNKTSKPLCLSPIQLGIYATLTIQSGEIVALPHKYARSLIMQQLFEEVSGQLFLDVTSC